MGFVCTMCKKETCIYYNFCDRCQTIVDLVEAKADRDECKKTLDDAEKRVVECQAKHKNIKKNESPKESEEEPELKH